MNHYQIVLQGAEKRVKQLLANQYQGRNELHRGGIVDINTLMVSPKLSIYTFNSLVALFLNRDSRYFRSEDLLSSIKELLDYIERIQRPDGRFDLLSVNFFSAPDTAFMTQRLNLAYRLIDRYGKGESASELKERLKEVITKAGYGIVKGGFHTPNHRWVITSALIISYNITGIEEFKKTAERYLAEGIDCNEEGEFSERSTGIYNAVNDNALILLSEELGRPDLLEHVRRNLEMLLTYLEPDGSLYTGNSTRQDQGKRFYPDNYYHLYLYMANYLNNGRFASIANRIIMTDRLYSNVQSYAESLYLFMLHPELKNFNVKEEPLPTNFEKFYRQSGVVRIRRGDYTITITENSTRFLEFKVGKLRSYMKICTSFGQSIAQFNTNVFDERWQREARTSPIRKGPEGYELEYNAYMTYYLPFDNLTEELEWGNMHYEKRKLTDKIRLNIRVLIREIEDGVRVRIKTDGCDRVPVKIELGFDPGCLVEGDSFVLRGKPGESIVASSGLVRVSKEDDIISVGPAFGKHIFTSEMRGSEPQSENDFTVYFTDFTHLDREIIFKRI